MIRFQKQYLLSIILLYLFTTTICSWAIDIENKKRIAFLGFSTKNVPNEDVEIIEEYYKYLILENKKYVLINEEVLQGLKGPFSISNIQTYLKTIKIQGDIDIIIAGNFSRLENRVIFNVILYDTKSQNNNKTISKLYLSLDDLLDDSQEIVEYLFFTKSIVIATDATWPPMEYVDENTKEIVGFDIDLMKAAAEAGGFSIEFKNIAWDGIFAGLATDKYDAVMSAVTITEKRQAAMDFSIPYINAGQVLIVRADTYGITTLADLKGKSAGAQIGTTGYFEIEKVQGVTTKSYDELCLAIEDLVNNRISGVVADWPIAADYVQNKDYKGKMKIVGEPFTEELYGVAVKKGNLKVLDTINMGLKKIIESSEIDSLIDKWLR